MKLVALIAVDVVLLSVAGWYTAEGIVASETPGATETKHELAYWSFLALLVALVVLVTLAIYRGLRRLPRRSSTP